MHTCERVIDLTSRRYARVFRAEADDLAQECWLAMLEHRSQIPYVAARAACVEAGRRLLRWRRDDKLATRPAICVPLPDETHDVPYLLGQLTPRQRQVVRLAFWHGLGVKETGEALGVKWTTAARLKHDALTTLRRIYA
jgi:DNA-directed RNA polymerase specialized sigma24 family protein